jgi:hypothetical protein
MTQEEKQDIQDELLYFAEAISEGQDFEILGIEIRQRIDVLNERADSLLDLSNGDENDYQIITGICYQYYRLMYG